MNENIKNTETDIKIDWKFFLKIFIILFLLFIFSYLVFNYAMETVIHGRKEVIVPDIKGKSALSAMEILSENNLAIKIQGFEFNNSVPIGTVLRQIPQSGISTRENRIVKVIFSQGGESVFIPNLIGLPLRNAELLLRQRQLVLGEVSESYSLKFEKGTVLNQDPKAEEASAKSSMVNIIVSAGPPPLGIIIMPDFRQKKLEDFQKWAQDNDIKFTIIKDQESIFPYETIIDQNPQSDSVIDKNSDIKITISDNKGNNQSSLEEPYNIKYQVSQSGSQRNIRIIAISKIGDRELFNAIREPGSIVELNIPKKSAEKIRIFVNGILVEERQVK